MATSTGIKGNGGTRQAVLEALRKTTEPIDGYGIAKVARMSPLQASRALEKLVAEGHALKQDDIDGLSDPAATFRASASS